MLNDDIIYASEANWHEVCVQKNTIKLHLFVVSFWERLDTFCIYYQEQDGVIVVVNFMYDILNKL